MDKLRDQAFRKVDLHIHTPRSFCYREPHTPPVQIVEAALSCGIDIIGITDHNTVEGIDVIRLAADQNGLVVFPGVELSTTGGHVIALFENDAPVADLRDFLNDCGLPQQGWGDAMITAQSSLEDVIEKIHERGGVSIAAHIERWPSGFLESNQPRRVKIRIHGNSRLGALEITVPRNKALWNNGQVRDYPAKHACIQGSDAHAPEEIGRRPVYIKMEEINLSGLRSAFLDYGTSIVFPEEIA